MTDSELLDMIEARLQDGRDDYLHIFKNGDEFFVEVDGASICRRRLREALRALYEVINGN